MYWLVTVNKANVELAKSLIRQVFSYLDKDDDKDDYKFIVVGEQQTVTEEMFDGVPINRFLTLPSIPFGNSAHGEEKTRGTSLKLPAIENLMHVMPPEEQLIYIDVDMVVNKHPSSLLQAIKDFPKDIPLFAVPALLPDVLVPQDHPYWKHPKVTYFHRFPKQPFDSGFMVFNIGAARTVLEKQSLCAEYQQTWESLHYPDSDVLNKVFSGHFNTLGSGANYRVEQYAPELLSDDMLDIIRNGMKDATFIHLNGVIKPWECSNNNAHDDLIKAQYDYDWLSDLPSALELPDYVSEGLSYHALEQTGVGGKVIFGEHFKPLCSAPFTYHNHREEGYRPCCSRHHPPVVPTGDWWNSPELKAIRKSMFSYDTLSDACKRCANMTNGGPIQYAKPMDAEKYDFETGYYRGTAKEIVIFVGNKCDLACEMCDSLHSDMHARTYPDRIIPVNTYVPDDKAEIITGHEDAEVITFMGGETFLNKDFYGLFRHALVETDKFLVILANGSRDLRNNRTFKELMIPNAERVHIVFSVDGGEEAQKRIRVGVNPQAVIDNIKLCGDLGLGCEAHYTLSKLNLHEFIPFLQYMEDEDLLTSDKFFFNISHVDFPAEYRPTRASEEDKQEALRLLDTYSDYLNHLIEITSGKTRQSIIEGIELIRQCAINTDEELYGEAV